MRISDWSSDVCSSDLLCPGRSSATRPALVSLPTARSRLCRRPVADRLARPHPPRLHGQFLMLTPALALAAAASGPADAAPHPAHHGHLPHSHTHAPEEIDETHGPILLQLTYTGEVMGNRSAEHTSELQSLMRI